MAARAATGGEGAGHARFTYRLRVCATAEAALGAEWGRCRWIWNEAVARSKAVHQHNVAHPQDKQTCGPAQLDKMLTRARAVTSWLRAGSSVPQQQIIRDFGKSRAKALKDVMERLPVRQRAGMPGFKRRHETRPTLNYTRRGFQLKGDGRLHLAGGIVLSVVWSRPLPADPTSVRVFQDSLGHWYASFVVPAVVEPLPETGAVVGVDWGVREIATTTSDPHDLPHPEHGKKARAKLSRYDRMMARRKPGKGQPASRGYRAAKHLRAKAHKKVARQREDTARKWAKQVVTDHDALAVEDFKPKFLARSTMSKKAADAAIGATKQALLHLARKHGRIVHLVHPAYTTMDCGGCGARTKHQLPLGERTYTCTACGHVSPRDKNSARVMLIRAGLSPAGAEGIRPDGTQFRPAA
ncbi:RNA-guided endonuclease InsQ/TnpB family protein [Streptomyces sp. NPDC051016]|uniref:RNA-guided endonuclease InsQ/TnpB family protein n=1 Tax=Streptomyces sp. NPDC051016 TaxID=3365638 RepID=UPI00379305AC